MTPTIYQPSASDASERDVFSLHGRGSARRRGRGGRGLALTGSSVLARAPAASGRVGVPALAAATTAAAVAVHEEEVLDDDLVLAAGLVRALVQPGFGGQQPALDQNRAALREVLADHLGGLAPRIAVD